MKAPFLRQTLPIPRAVIGIDNLQSVPEFCLFRSIASLTHARSISSIGLSGLTVTCSSSVLATIEPCNRLARRQFYRPSLRQFDQTSVRSCLRQPCRHRFTAAATGAYDSNKERVRSRISLKLKILLAIAASAVVWSFGEDHRSVSSMINCFARIGTVAVAVVRCVIKYYRVLNASYNGDSASKADAISKVHWECAQIALKAIETNGGVYLKIGQHLSAMAYLIPMV